MGAPRPFLAAIATLGALVLTGCGIDTHKGQYEADSFNRELRGIARMTAHHDHIGQAISDGRLGKAEEGLVRTRWKLDRPPDDSMEMILDLSASLIEQRGVLEQMLDARRSGRNGAYSAGRKRFDDLRVAIDETIQSGDYNTFGAGGYVPDRVDAEIADFHESFETQYRPGEPWPLTHAQRINRRLKMRSND